MTDAEKLAELDMLIKLAESQRAALARQSWRAAKKERDHWLIVLAGEIVARAKKRFVDSGYADLSGLAEIVGIMDGLGDGYEKERCRAYTAKLKAEFVDLAKGT